MSSDELGKEMVMATKAKVTVPEGRVYTDDKGRQFEVFYSGDMDRDSLTVAQAFAFGASKKAVVVIGPEITEIMSPDAFTAMGLEEVE